MQLLMAGSTEEINDDGAGWWEGAKGKLSREVRKTCGLFYVGAATIASSH